MNSFDAYTAVVDTCIFILLVYWCDYDVSRGRE